MILPHLSCFDAFRCLFMVFIKPSEEVERAGGPFSYHRHFTGTKPVAAGGFEEITNSRNFFMAQPVPPDAAVGALGFGLLLVRYAEKVDGQDFLICDMAFQGVGAEALHLMAQLRGIVAADTVVEGDGFYFKHETTTSNLHLLPF